MADICNAPTGRYSYEFDVDGPLPAAWAFRWVRGCERILELGAAEGHMTEKLRERGARVVTVEFDPVAAVRLGKVADTVLEADLDTLTEAELAEHGPFDAVIATDILEHLRDPDRVVEMLRDLLVDDGALVVSLPNVAHGDVRLALLSGSFEMTPTGLLDSTHLRFYTVDTGRALLEQHGFEVCEVQRAKAAVGTTELADLCADEFLELRDRVTKEPEADTYQFTMRAAKRGKPVVALMRELARLRAEAQSATLDVVQARQLLAHRDRRIDELVAASEHAGAEHKREIDRVAGELAALNARIAFLEDTLRALRRSRSLRAADAVSGVRHMWRQKRSLGSAIDEVLGP